MSVVHGNSCEQFHIISEVVHCTQKMKFVRMVFSQAAVTKNRRLEVNETKMHQLYAQTLICGLTDQIYSFSIF